MKKKLFASISSLNPSEEFLDIYNLMNDIRDNYQKRLENKEKIPVYGFGIFIEREKVSKNTDMCLAPILLDFGDDTERSLQKVASSLAHMMRESPAINAIIRLAVEHALKDACNYEEDND